MCTEGEERRLLFDDIARLFQEFGSLVGLVLCFLAEVDKQRAALAIV